MRWTRESTPDQPTMEYTAARLMRGIRGGGGLADKASLLLHVLTRGHALWSEVFASGGKGGC